MKRLMVILTLLLSVVLLGGCATHGYNEPKDADLVKLSYNATDRLLKKSRGQLPQGSMVVVSTLVNVNELGQTASFGRIISSQIASAFNNAGYRIKAMELPTNLFIKEESGMVYLSDETKKALKDNDATVLVAGIFASGRRTAYVSIRMVDVASETVISTTDFAVPMGPDAKVLLQNRAVGSNKP